MIYPPATNSTAWRGDFPNKLLTSQQKRWVVHPTDWYELKTRGIWFTQHTDENMTNEVTDLPKQW